jgi:ABC-type transporter Mla subunit MlaD
MMDELTLLIAEVSPVIAVALILSAALFQLARTLQPVLQALMQTVGKLSEHIEKTQQALETYNAQERQQTELLTATFAAVQQQGAGQSGLLKTQLAPLGAQLEQVLAQLAALQAQLQEQRAGQQQEQQQLVTRLAALHGELKTLCQGLRVAP